MIEHSCNDRGGLGSSREVMDGLSEGEGSPECKEHSRRGGARGRMLSGSNEHHPQRLSKEDQKQNWIEEVLNVRHQRKKLSGQKRKKKTAFKGGRQSESIALEVDVAIQVEYVK